MERVCDGGGVFDDGRPLPQQAAASAHTLAQPLLPVLKVDALILILMMMMMMMMIDGQL
jgi:hypothetical protein